MERETSTEQDRRPYEAPAVSSLGRVAEVTRGALAAPGGDAIITST